MTGNGYGALTLGQTTTELIAISNLKSSTLPYRISLTRRKRIGIRRSQLRKLSGKQRKQAPLVKTDGLFLPLSNLVKKMLESFIPAIIAIVTGTAVLFNRVNHRVTEIDRRVDKLELKIVESFTTKTDFNAAMERMEAHLIRIEDKMDQLVSKDCSKGN